MARVRRDFIVQLTALLTLAWVVPALAQEAAEAGPTGVYDRPTLVLDPGMHTALIRRADVDAKGRYVVTGSDDKTVRVWSMVDGGLVQTIRLPAGPESIGKVYAVAISPDGEIVAAGGQTRWAEADRQEQIYLFNRETSDRETSDRETSDREPYALAERIDGLPGVVGHLTFSPDERYLAATLGDGHGLRVYDRDAGWAEVGRDDDTSYSADFSADGRLATTSDDGRVRLYDRTFQLVTATETTGGRQPYGIAFNADGAKLAVGYQDTTAVDLFDGRTLALLPGPDTSDIDHGNLMSVAWSADADTLFAAGRYQIREGGHWNTPVMAWSADALGTGKKLRASNDAVLTLAPLADGGLLVAATDPYLAVLDPSGQQRWAQRRQQSDFRAQCELLAVSEDGAVVDFGYEYGGKASARFDLTALDLRLDPPANGLTANPKQTKLPVENWKDEDCATLERSKSLGSHPSERLRSLVIHPDEDSFVFGTDFHLLAYGRNFKPLWQRVTPEVVWAVNISGDGRLVVAAYGDGTIRWHRMDDGSELLAFFPLADRTNWVAWTPDGFYASTPGAFGALRWHINRSWDAPANAIPLSDIAELRRPDVLPLVLQEMEIVKVVGLAGLNEARIATQRRLDSAVKPGTRLHVLAIGVGDYNEQKAKHLRLEYADDDAYDVASALLNTQGSLYAKVNQQVLRNEEATEAGIYDAFAAMRAGMQPGDVAVVHFSGHGALVGGGLYLLPHEVDARTEARVKASAIEIGDFRTELLGLAQKGRVLVLLDACRSGAVSADGANTSFDAAQLRTALAEANVTVLTSSSGQENSIEHEEWQNGAFTEVFLEALGQDADSDRNSVVSMTELTRYVTAGVPRLVREVDAERQQTPGVEMRFEHTIFAAGL